MVVQWVWSCQDPCVLTCVRVSVLTVLTVCGVYMFLMLMCACYNVLLCVGVPHCVHRAVVCGVAEDFRLTKGDMGTLFKTDVLADRGAGQDKAPEPRNSP